MASITFDCSKCKKSYTIPIDAMEVSAGGSDCELCGYHSWCTISVNCPECGQNDDIYTYDT